MYMYQPINSTVSIYHRKWLSQSSTLNVSIHIVQLKTAILFIFPINLFPYIYKYSHSSLLGYLLKTNLDTDGTSCVADISRGQGQRLPELHTQGSYKLVVWYSHAYRSRTRVQFTVKTGLTIKDQGHWSRQKTCEQFSTHRYVTPSVRKS